MAGARGYSSYRGRGAWWKALLAVLLILVILAALVVMYLLQNIVYDENGRAQIILPWQTEQLGDTEDSDIPEEELEDLELIVQEPEPPPSSITLSLPDGALTLAAWQEALASAQGTENCAALAVTLKATGGQIYFDASGAVSRTVKTAADSADALAALTSQEDLRTIARFSCLHDSLAANANVRAMGLRNTGGYIFYDGNNSQWLDPTKEAAREYLCSLAVQIAELGFDELLLTDVCYPTEGKVNKINYNGDTPLNENLALLVTGLAAALEPYDITLSIELAEPVISTGPDEVSGQDLAILAPLVDCIYAVTEPERIESLAAAVEQAAGEGREVAFIPELAADVPDLTGNRLILPEAA